AFDEVRALTMDELWAVPAALRAALIEAYQIIARRTIEAQRQRAEAERWVLAGARPDALGPRPAQAYLERALQLMHEQDMPDARMELERQLSLRDMDAQTLIRTEHERQAIDLLWLSNLVATLHMLVGLRWDECFMALSRTEAELRRDPAGTYPDMDDPSRARIRAQVSKLSRRTGMGENTIARHAIAAASAGDGIRSEVCWWLYDDEGVAALTKRLGAGRAARELTPDPTGRSYIASVALLAAAALMVYLAASPGYPAAILALPILWGVGAALANAAASQVKPAALLKMKIKSVPDELRTLVVMPALLSGPARAVELCEQLVALGCLETDRNLEFLLLGDLPDADQRVMPGDREIADAAAGAIARANERAGRAKYHLLWRERAWCEGEGRYMAPERKRGALMALNSLLLGGENEFADADAAGALADRFALVITLDAGTRMIPGTAHALIGAIAHPLNRSRVEGGRRRGYAVLQPRMELPADAVVNRFVLLFGGEGGVDSYPTSVSDVYQDLCGQGIFGGKGIYDLRPFHGALDGALPPGAVLSHDLIEGIIAGAGFLNDVTLYDGHPRTARAWLTRLHRWTRGDWQLLPCLLGAWRVKLRALDRYKLLDNLRRSVVPIVQLCFLIGGLWARRPSAIALALAPWWLPMLLSIGRLRLSDCVRFFLRLALLPAEAAALADAICRTLWRALVSRRRLLEWVTADDADRQKGEMARWPLYTASALLLPALLASALRGPAWAIAAAALAALWCLAPAWARRLECPLDPPDALSDEQRAAHRDLAGRTWRFFDCNVPDNGLPPDNVQLDPPTGAARRTSPTNVGLYLLSCLAARELALIDDGEMRSRIAASVQSLERMEKWRGHLYNWYDIDRMAPLEPRYVSSVDGGNLAACLLTCASAIEDDRALADRMEALAREMDFTALYDENRKLFAIGMDVGNNRLSASHYDLMASESRILSYVALMLRQVPVEHWAHLGRAMAPVHGSQALLSWSGTMFEYLMPELFMPSIKGTLLRQSRDAVVRAQALSAIHVGGEPMPWGVSESGYYAFDLRLNYQYRAFGLPTLSLRGDAADRVIAPYASMLALSAAPREVTDNLRRMAALGLISTQGLYEAVDCAPERLPEGADSRIVYSHMAHHQGMILAAQANALCDQAIARRFMGRPEAQALKLLLQEKPATRLRLGGRGAPAVAPSRQAPPARLGRLARPDLGAPDCHLMFGADAALLIGATGAGFLRRWGVLANRREFKPGANPQGFFTHLENRTDSRRFLLSGQRDCPKWLSQRAHFDAGAAEWVFKADGLEARLTVCLSPEDGALCRRVALTNATPVPIELSIADCFEVALCNEADYAAHPTFQNLFVESRCAALNALCFARRPRNPGERCPVLLHAVAGGDGGAQYETDLSRLIGRTGALSAAGGIAREFTQTAGQVLNPCSALRVDVKVPPMGRAFVAFAVGLVEPDDAQAFIDRHSSLDTSLRALELAGTQARAMLKFLSLTPRLHHALQRASALVAYPGLRPRPCLLTPPKRGFERRELWALGISGEYPILLGVAADKEGLSVMRELVRGHEFYRAMGLWCDLVLVNDYGNDYEQPVRDGLSAMVASSHLLGLGGQPGGVHLLEGAQLTDQQRALLRTAAALCVEGGRGGLVDQIKSQLPTDEPRPTPAAHMPPGRRLARLKHGFSPDGYRVECSGAVTTPAPWVNVLANPNFGAMVSERGGGFIWHQNSRNGRVTPFDNDA
ncbi:MAG: DUF3131 domain-containing protein, partial [Clostridiales bacterium]|nr:DUF3131 domain-containing protein [Clostridiales bacterium]